MQYYDADFDALFAQEDVAPDTFEVSTTQQYVQPTFFRGLNKIVDRKTGRTSREVATGFYFEIGKLTASLLQVMQRLEAEGKATLFLVEHSGQGQRRQLEYYKLHQDVFVLLTHGVHASRIASNDITKQVGLMSGVRVSYKDGEPTYSKESFTQVLAVHPDLYEAGYTDERGLPIPVLIRISGESGGELATAIAAHAKFIQWVRGQGIDTRAQMFSYYCPLRASEDTRSHANSKGEAQDVCYPVSHEGEYQQASVEALRVPDQLLRGVRRLLFVALDGKLVPGGLAVDWCREQYAANKAHMEELDPKRDLAWGRNKQAPVWLLNRRALKEQQYLRQPAENGGQAERIQFQQVDEEEAELRERLEAALAFFTPRESDLSAQIEVFIEAFDAGAYTKGETAEYIKELSAKKQTLLRAAREKPAFS